MNFRSAAASHVGMVRKLNEDSYARRDDLGLWAVADGMGGHQAGDEASRQVTSALEEVTVGGSMADLLHSTRSALNEANARLMGLADRFEVNRVPGSTVATLLIHDNEAAAVWVGDSRIYRLRDGMLEQITRDHSHVQELLDQRLISAQEAESHPMSNVITRAVGIEEPLDIDVLHFDAAPGDRFLVCSDGLSKLLSSDEIQGMMQTDSLDECVQSLLHTALVRGAPDNVTVITVECLTE